MHVEWKAREKKKNAEAQMTMRRQYFFPSQHSFSPEHRGHNMLNTTTDYKYSNIKTSSLHFTDPLP